MKKKIALVLVLSVIMTVYFALSMSAEVEFYDYDENSTVIEQFTVIEQVAFYVNIEQLALDDNDYTDISVLLYLARAYYEANRIVVDADILVQEYTNVIQSAFDNIEMPIITFSFDDSMDSFTKEFIQLSRDLLAPVNILLKDMVGMLDFESDVNIVFDNVFEHYFFENIVISISGQYGVFIESAIEFSIYVGSIMPFNNLYDRQRFRMSNIFCPWNTGALAGHLDGGINYFIRLNLNNTRSYFVNINSVYSDTRVMDPRLLRSFERTALTFTGNGTATPHVALNYNVTHIHLSGLLVVIKRDLRLF